MECNKDEASRAKEISQAKLLMKDIMGARRFALKAQNLYPQLEGMPQLMASIDVYAAAENKVNGEIDWYGVLGVNRRADDETVRKQYRRLVLLLHPDKNKFVGANDVFKLVSEAWSVLSDKSKKAAYDQKTDAGVSQRASFPTSGANHGPGSKGFNHGAKSNVNPCKTTTQSTKSSTHVTSDKSKCNTFWTMCLPCKMQYEYLRAYLNQNIRCPNCQEPFLAFETAPPSIISTKSSIFWNFP